jgi:hypothetical protein
MRFSPEQELRPETRSPLPGLHSGYLALSLHFFAIPVMLLASLASEACYALTCFKIVIAWKATSAFHLPATAGRGAGNSGRNMEGQDMIKDAGF